MPGIMKGRVTDFFQQKFPADTAGNCRFEASHRRFFGHLKPGFWRPGI